MHAAMDLMQGSLQATFNKFQNLFPKPWTQYPVNHAQQSPLGILLSLVYQFSQEIFSSSIFLNP